ncbi:hypothetical protein RJ641_006930 [Dillenia turbinata]|uniref:Uncharacterized protein n=1 Tax=Dillenia turbinata TaxID=194707 RepID=A0AAN8VB88_9MAGN
MSSGALQLWSCSRGGVIDDIMTSLWGLGINGRFGKRASGVNRRGYVRVYPMSSNSNGSLKMNLNEYMVTLDKPLGFGNAERSRIIMVGDTSKKASASPGGRLVEIKDYGDTRLVLERPFSPFPIQRLHLVSDLDNLFNRGRVPVATWNKSILPSNLQASSEGSGNSGFAVFSSKFLMPQVWKLLRGQNGDYLHQIQRNSVGTSISQLVCIFSADVEWALGNLPLEEYIKALEFLRLEKETSVLCGPSIAFVEKEPSFTFVWNGQEGEEVFLVGDFTGNWKEPIRAVHKGTTTSTSFLGNGGTLTTSPTERDERGNINNVLVIGDTANVRPSIRQQKMDTNIVKVIERPLTENERFLLAKAARCVAFSICPIR